MACPSTRHADIGRCTSVQALAKAKASLLITDRRHVSQMNPTTILRSPIGDIVGLLARCNQTRRSKALRYWRHSGYREGLKPEASVAIDPGCVKTHWFM
jgi:hypothetical protein